MIRTRMTHYSEFVVGACLAVAVATIGSDVAMSMQTCGSAEQGGEAPPPGREEALTIHVRGNNWGEGRTQDIQVLLANVASHITKHLREGVSPVIEVWNVPRHGPMILYRYSGSSTYLILLDTGGRRWAQYSYQFAHEFCHLLSDYERLADSANAWFHESLCELTSVFALRSMAATWETSSPYRNWAAYAGSLRDYADDHLSTVQDALPGDAEVGPWLRGYEPEARKDPYNRKANLIVALRMLPVFERHPEGWNALGRLPASNALIDEYLRQWKEDVHPCDRGFVEQIEDALGLPFADTTN